MRLITYAHIAIRIIIFFSAGMMMTYVPENLREFFGDTSCVGKSYVTEGYYKYKVNGCPESQSNFAIDELWVWGARHYWFSWMSFFLFVLSGVGLVVSIYKIINREYKFDI